MLLTTVARPCSYLLHPVLEEQNCDKLKQKCTFITLNLSGSLNNSYNWEFYWKPWSFFGPFWPLFRLFLDSFWTLFQPTLDIFKNQMRRKSCLKFSCFQTKLNLWNSFFFLTIQIFFVKLCWNKLNFILSEFVSFKKKKKSVGFPFC